MQKIDPAKINANTGFYRLAPNDILLVQIEPIEVSGSSYKIDKGNQIKIGFTTPISNTYKISPGDGLSLEFPDEIEGMYEILVGQDGNITLPKVGKSLKVVGLTLEELNKKSLKSYAGLYLSPKVSWSITRTFDDALARMSNDYAVGTEGDVVVPGLGRFNILGKNANEVEVLLTKEARLKFKNDVSANVSISQNVSKGQVDTRLTPSGLQMYTNLNNLPTKVTEEGEVYVTGLGLLKAEGKTVAELKSAILAIAQVNYQNPIAVNVAVQQYADYTVFIGGEVRQPGRYPFARKLSMLKLIAQAGWVNEYGDLANALLLRADDDNHYSIYTTNLAEIFDGKGEGNQDFQITPQDLIIVPPTAIAKTNRYITQYVRGILPFGTSVSYNINSNPTQR
jgi:protein involved in polysaccharide export with SLBB domain